MGGWRIKFMFLLIVYFAGFATAVYCLAPAPENQSYQTSEKSFAYAASTINSEEFAQSFNAGLHRCLDFGKDAAIRVGKYAKQAYDEKQRQSGG
ncbi:MAG: hypothetical protein KAS75_06485 [Planctomycetes bacterium]|nr:hypothetical protein [Planctomycetota bacterium]